ncbi:MAG: helix-turn-helix transcriptional regulator [Clostridia bacterium]|nr:helix-turn-helix transcriptional regulator [Clostridia bacterium]MEE1184996.1 AraC family transcriptional regulator [Acutalibacteraceae bacterium]
MINSIGEILLQNGNPLLKMWSIHIDTRIRPFINHSHTRFEITVVDSGSGEYTTENAVYPMEPGDVFIFSSSEVHCITKTGKDGLSITNLHFEPRYLSEAFSENSSDSYIDFCFSHSTQFSNRIPAKKAEILRNHHRIIKEEFLNKNDRFSLAVRAHLHLILIDLLRNHNYSAPTDIHKVNFDIISVYDYIEQHLSDKLTLNSIASIAGLSPNYFSNIFKKLNSISLWDYITARRIEKATRLICSKKQNLSMLDIALQCGFNNTVNFNKAFKKHRGITPSELRKNPKLLLH